MYFFLVQPFDYLDTKDKDSLAKHNLTYSAVFEMNVSYELSGIHVPTDIYDEGEVWMIGSLLSISLQCAYLHFTAHYISAPSVCINTAV